MNYRTKILHTGKENDSYTGAASIPVYQVSTFAQKDPVEFGPYRYARAANPTREALEQTIAMLEGGVEGFAFSSGVAAISSVFLLFQPGDHLVVAEDVYGGTFRVLETIFRRWGLDYSYVDMTDPVEIEKAVRKETKAIFAETPSNPLLKITDLAAVKEIAGKHDLVTIVDNTFMTPYLQRPLELGFDIVVHSATKFLGGHSDLIAGLAVAREGHWAKRIKDVQVSFGSVLGPQDSWLALRGIKTLAARMEMQQKSAGEVASWLAGQPEIRRVYYPTLDSHPGREIHLMQSSGGGAVVSFELENGEKALKFMRRMRLPLLGGSLGGVESILSYPTTMSHAAMPESERHARGINDGLVRLSVGLEDVKDLCDDLRRAMADEGLL
jgi:cystathionine beta-lyase